MAEEQLRVTEAWEYFTNRSGVELSRRTFFSYIEDEHCEINGQVIDLTPNQINGNYFIARSKIDALIAALRS